MNKIILSTVAAMLMGGSAFAGDVIAPPVSKYVEETPLPPKRPTNFGKTDNQKVAQKVQEVTTRK
jgi:hypothetical protein